MEEISSEKKSYWPGAESHESYTTIIFKDTKPTTFVSPNHTVFSSESHSETPIIKGGDKKVE